MDLVKVEGITKWPTPTTVKQVGSFLGFCNFYCAFIPKFSDIARPLNDLTRKNYQWRWEMQQQNVFDELKCACSREPVLRTPDWNKPFIMETDASGYALGVVITQEHKDGIHPIAFHSQSLLDAEKNYDAYNKEMCYVLSPLLLFPLHPILIPPLIPRIRPHLPLLLFLSSPTLFPPTLLIFFHTSPQNPLA